MNIPRSQHRAPSTQRRVSFSKPSSHSRQLDDKCSILHRAKNLSNPVPRNVSSSRPILVKPALKLDKSNHNTSKGVGIRKQQDATSSTTVDLRRRSTADPTPAHLKYGVFRKFSKLRKPSADVTVAPQPRASESTDIRSPLVRERSETFRRRQEEEFRERTAALRRRPSSIDSQITDDRIRQVHLTRTEPIHLDIKPKKFSSMMWC